MRVNPHATAPRVPPSAPVMQAHRVRAGTPLPQQVVLQAHRQHDELRDAARGAFADGLAAGERLGDRAGWWRGWICGAITGVFAGVALIVVPMAAGFTWARHWW